MQAHERKEKKKEFTSKFQFTNACFPDTSESFIHKSIGGFLPKVRGSREGFVDCTEQQTPREGPLITSKVRQLPALLKQRYVDMFRVIRQCRYT